MVSKLAEALNSGAFSVTCELNPPKGVDLDRLYQKAALLEDVVTAFNITDSAGSRMTMAPIAVAHLLVDKGIESVLQITGRDRNKMALQSELLAAGALGATNVLCMSGDPPGGGDHPDAKAVFDLDAVGLIQAATSLKSGQDISGNELSGAPDFFLGAVANPGSPDLDKEVRRMEEKVEAGAAFFQTQATYEPDTFQRFMDKAGKLGVPILAGQIVLKSGNMARNLNANLPGVHVPDGIIEELDGAEDRSQASVEITARIIRDIRPMCSGVHIMAIGWESRVPRILEAAGITNGR